MNLFGLSPGELILIFLIAMIVIGPEKLPETAASIGRWIREFRRVTAELTEQFADENPFTEIQRALSLTDDPIESPAAIATPVDAVGDQKPSFAEVVAANVATTSISQAPAPVVARRSDYFDYPSYYSAIEDAWTHSGLSEYHARGPHPASFTEAIDDEWIHGVPVGSTLPVLLEVPLEPAISGPDVAEPEVPADLASDPEPAAISVESTPDVLNPLVPRSSNGAHSPPRPSEIPDHHHDVPVVVGAGVGHSEEQPP